MCFFNTEPPPPGCLLVKQLSWFGFKPKESPQSVLNENDMELEHTGKDSHGECVCAGGWGKEPDRGAGAGTSARICPTCSQNPLYLET